MIGHLGYDHLRQQTRSRRALFDRLRRLGGGLHRAVAGVFLAHLLDDDHLGRNEFVALARLFPDGPQILLASRTVLFLLRQIMHDALALQIPRQRLPAAFPFLGSRLATGRRGLVVVILDTTGCWGCLAFRLPRLPQGRKQRQLIGRELFALAVALGV